MGFDRLRGEKLAATAGDGGKGWWDLLRDRGRSVRGKDRGHKTDRVILSNGGLDVLIFRVLDRRHDRGFAGKTR